MESNEPVFIYRMDYNQRVQGIKNVREVTGWGLKDSKCFCDNFHVMTAGVPRDQLPRFTLEFIAAKFNTYWRANKQSPMYDVDWVDIAFRKVLDAVFEQVSGEILQTPSAPSLLAPEGVKNYTLREAMLSGIAELYNQGHYELTGHLQTALDRIGHHADVVVLKISEESGMPFG